MVTTITREDLQRLRAAPEGPCVSLYMPTHRPASGRAEDRIRLKNLVREAEQRLVDEEGLRPPAAEAILAPARALLEDDAFWRGRADGLALLVAGDGVRSHRVPVALEESVHVGRRFHLKPLLALLASADRFYLLAISQNRVRLFDGDRHELRARELGDVPQSLVGALGADWEQASLQFHTGTPAAAGGAQRAAMFHGQGAGVDERKEEVTQFCAKVDRGLLDGVLSDRRPPLVLAAVEYVASIYRSASHYPNLVEGIVEGNPDEETAEALHAEALAVVAPELDGARREATQRLQDLLHTPKASADLREVVVASAEGRVDTLFLVLDDACWGRTHPAQRRVEVHEERRDDDEDLLDVAALATLENGGTVFAVARDEIPDGGSLAAVYRY